MNKEKSERFGWWLFVACAALFIAASWRSGDALALAGSILFMLGNVAFLAPHYVKEAKRERNEV
ncbi:MAG: hypothetical protein MRY63_10515 [Neomegalonema sp.]|nr:hypothetical protein [Neomegalonema sp.]